METKIEFPLPVRGESYGTYCDRLQAVAERIIKEGRQSQRAVKILVRVLLKAPSDFDSTLGFKPFREARKFLQAAPKTTRDLFWQEGMRIGRIHFSRLKFLVGDPSRSPFRH